MKPNGANSQNGDSGSSSLRLYDVFLVIMDVLVLIVKFHAELIYAIISLFLKTEMKDISGEIVLITGTGHGIGRELALQYADEGCDVVCIDINEENNKQTVKDCNKLKKGRAYAYVCDVTDREAVLALGNKIRQEVGHVSVIVNNAGIMPCHKLDQTTVKEIRSMFELNVLAHFWIFEAFLPFMKQKNRGHLISISSMAGIIGNSNLVPYCATKFAVRGMMEALFEELREQNSNIEITVIFPYMVDTGLCKNPVIKFKNMMKQVSPKDAASSIITAHRKNLKDVSIPAHLNPLNQFFRNYPYKCQILVKDFFGSGLGNDLEC